MNCETCGREKEWRKCEHCDKQRVAREMEEFAKSQKLSVTVEAL